MSIATAAVREPLPRDHSPWGQIQDVVPHAPGIVFVGTASHGGIWLSPERQAAMPPELLTNQFLKGTCWYEEDCDWCLPFVAFEADIVAAALSPCALATIRFKGHLAMLKFQHPAAFAWWSERNPTIGVPTWSQHLVDITVDAVDR